MEIKCIINGRKRCLNVNPAMCLRELLVQEGHLCVRDSDDREGFAGSDTILFNGRPVYSNLMLAFQADGAEIRTPDSLSDGKSLSPVQQAMVDAGVVQSAYNAPAAALLLTWLLEKHPHPAKEQIKDALSGIFIRDAGYEHYYLAVKLATSDKKPGELIPEFRDKLKYVGKALPKVDGPQLVSGAKAFVEDLKDADACWMEVLRSPYAHAYIADIDTSEAEKLDGVIKILTYKNVPDVYYTCAGQGAPEPSPHDKKLINQKMRHVGDRVAAICAETKEIALEAKKLIKVKYEVLRPVLTVEEAMAPGAPVVQNGSVSYGVGAPSDLDDYNKGSDPREGSIHYPFPIHADSKRNLASAAHGQIGDVEEGFRQADAVIEHVYQTDQVQCTPLEVHVCFSKMEGDRLVIKASTQVPYHMRRVVARICSIPESRVHVIKAKVGGGYGSKQDILIEDLCAYMTWVTGKPVYTRNTRSEEFIANSTRHPMKLTVKMGGKKDGTITAIQIDCRANTGPYGNHCLTVPMNSCSKTLPLFKVDNMKFDVYTYYTNCPPAGAYQGYGAPKGAFALMMALAELASALGQDYKQMVKKNCVEEGYMLNILKGLGEGREGNVVPVGSCGLGEAIDRGAKMMGWDEPLKQDSDSDWKRGRGFAMIQQGSGLPGLDHSTAIAKMETDGSIIVQSGGSDLGTGLDTITAKVTAETLCIPMDKVSVVSGDTDASGFDTGAYASSGTYFSGNASLAAAVNLKKKIIAEAALQMGEIAENLHLEHPGMVVSKDGRKLSFYELIHTATSGTGRGQLMAEGSFVTDKNAIPYGAHFAQVAVNVRTGEIKLEKFYALQDAGTPINPELALCQMYGAALKSIGHSLYETMVLDKDGVCRNANLTDYHVPMIYEQPDDFRAVLIDVDDYYGPFGAKSISEIATNGAAPAIGNAIADACGVWIRDWPFTSEKILKGLGKF